MSGSDSIFLYLAWGLCALGGLAVLAPAPAHVRIEGFLQAHGAEAAMSPTRHTAP